MIKPGLYKSPKVQWYDGWPFQKIKVLKVENGVVSFSTEWPVRKLDCNVKDFNERFHKWN